MTTPKKMRFACLVVWIATLAGGTLTPAIAQVEAEAGVESEATPIWIDPRFEPVDTNRRWLTTPIVKLADGSLATLVDNGLIASSAGEWSWSPARPIDSRRRANSTAAGVPNGGGTLLRLNDNALLVMWRDERHPDTLEKYWDRATGNPVAEARGDVWAISSTDGGGTWGAAVKVLDNPGGYPPKHVIQTKSGTVIAPVQYHASDPGRNVIAMMASRDDGLTWTHSQDIDLHGKGHHDGAFEPTLVELKDGRIWVLIRTNHDEFYQSFSSDDGQTWTKPEPSGIAASSSPGHVTRLASGRLLLLWNRLYPEGKTAGPRRGGDQYFSDVAASWHRQELSVALSEDEGKTWTQPIVVARHPKLAGRVAYPYVFQNDDGRIYLFANQGKLEVAVSEEALLGGTPTP